MATNTMGVSRLLGLQLTPGKFRGLQRLASDNGTLTMVALDQNSSMISMIKASLKEKGQDREPTYDEIVEAKVQLAKHLAPHASGLLVDAYYGVWNTVASGAIPRNTALLVRVEKSGGDKNSRGAPLGAYEPGLSVGKIKRMGADAVKLLAQFEPTEPNSAEHQFAFIQHVYQECQKHDILMLLEPVAFPFDGEKKDSESLLKRKADTVIESARQISRFCDVYKAEFPGTSGRDSDKVLEENLKKLNAACERPWVLLSAGVKYEQYRTQVEMAMKAGASGVLGGRAFWQEFFQQTSCEAKDKYAAEVAAARVREIDGLVKKYASPWYARYGLTKECLAKLRCAEGWHFRYGGGFGGVTSGASRSVEGEVY